jgi:hypothetical protein
MPEMKVALLKGDRAASDVEYRAVLPVNMYAIDRPVFDVAGFMASHPGFTLFADVNGLDRGAVYNERLTEHLRVSGTQLIVVDPDGSITDVGFVDTAGNTQLEASMPYSFNTQAVIAGLKMYLWDGVTFTEITDPDLGLPIDACWINGYYFITDGEYLYHSELDQDASPPPVMDDFINPIKFATSEFSPDPTLGVAKTQDNQVMVFNRYTTEFFYDAANEGFVFARVQGKAVKAGIIGTHLKIEMNGLFFCLGSAKDEAATFLMIGAGQSANFSNREVDHILSTYTEAELAPGVMTTRTDDRDRLVYVHLARHTLLYNHAIGESMGPDFAWSILQDGVEDTPYSFTHGIFDPRLVEWLGGDRALAELYIMDQDTVAQDGNVSEMMLNTPFFALERGSVDEVEMETIPGQAIGEVNAFLSITYDGVTYSREWAIEVSSGLGDYNRRMIFRRLGYCRDWMSFRLRVVSKNKIAIADMVIRYG